MIPQFNRPELGNPYYNTKTSGGYNPCIQGNPAKCIKGLNVLPNCVGYAVARLNELGEYGTCKYLGNTNACNFIKLARKQGLQISHEPTLGGVMVWTGGTGNYGHVACVEALVGDNLAITSESEYFGQPFVVYNRRRGDGNWREGCYWMGKSYKYEGCIVNPAIKEEEPLTYEQFCEYMTRWLKDNAEMQFSLLMRSWLAIQAIRPADPWAKDAIEYCKQQGLMVGDADGNFRPQSFVKREELASVLRGIDE